MAFPVRRLRSACCVNCVCRENRQIRFYTVAQVVRQNYKEASWLHGGKAIYGTILMHSSVGRCDAVTIKADVSDS